MNVVDIIRAKRDGARLSDEQLRWFIDAYTKGEVADEQAAALCMAIYFNGMQPGELAVWTEAMIDSGERLDLSAVGRPTVDKHSTGGVGDKVSLVLAPLVAACGAAVPQLSGRGLGHSGGTLDKLEAIAGWRSALTPSEMVTNLQTVGCVIAAAGSGLAPADRKLYALRDVTATVESIPLIASSIMSKKIAEGTEALVLDVKTGSGAFIRERDDAIRLAEAMVVIGEANGVRTSALITAMDTVLGRTAGNAIEVTESVEVLSGRTQGVEDLVEVTLALAEEMVALSGVGGDTERTARRWVGPREVARDGHRPGRRPGRPGAGSGPAAVDSGGAHGLRHPARRPRGRDGRLAARRRTVAQGRPGECGRRSDVRGEGRRRSRGRPTHPRAAHRRSFPGRGGRRSTGRCDRRRARTARA